MMPHRRIHDAPFHPELPVCVSVWGQRGARGHPSTSRWPVVVPTDSTTGPSRINATSQDVAASHVSSHLNGYKLLPTRYFPTPSLSTQISRRAETADDDSGHLMNNKHWSHNSAQQASAAVVASSCWPCHGGDTNSGRQP